MGPLSRQKQEHLFIGTPRQIHHIFQPVVSVRGSLFCKELITPARSLHTRVSLSMATWTFVRSFNTEINREYLPALPCFSSYRRIQYTFPANISCLPARS